MDVITAFLYITFGLLFLGTIIAFSPTLVVTELAILTKSKTPLVHTIAFIAGVALPVILISIFAITSVNPNQDIEIPSTTEVVRLIPIIDIIIASIFIYSGIKLKSSKPKSSKLKPDKMLSTKTLFWFGALKMATSLSSLAAIVLAAQFLKSTTSQSSQQIFGLAWLVVAAILPFVIIAYLKTFKPARFDSIQRYSDKISDFDWRSIIAITLIIGGIGLMVFGIINIENVG